MKKTLILLLILYSGCAFANTIELSTTSSNIGIGTINAGAKLDVVGGIRATTINGLTFSTATGNATTLVTSTGGVVNGDGGKWDASGNWVDSGSAFNAGGGGLSGLTQGYLLQAATASTASNSALFQSSGNIGVGSINPGKTVDVTGDVRVSGKYYGDGSSLTGISGSVSGLTANKVPKASNSTTIVDGIITDNGTNVGIGSAVPAAKLDVAGAGQFSQGVNLTGSGALQIATANNLQIDPNHSSFTTPVMTFIGSNVGIGTVTAGKTVDISGTLRVSGVVTASNINGSTQCIHADTNGVLSGSGSDCGAGGGSGTITSSTPAQVPVLTGATTVAGNSGFVMDSTGGSGNIGVGTTVPSNYLQTNTGGSSIVSVGAGTERFEAIYTGTYGATGGGRIILGSDNGTALTSGSRIGSFVFGGATDTTKSGGSLGLSSAVTAFSEEAFTGSTEASQLRFETTASGAGRTAKLVVTGAGNVGIGTSIPGSVFEIRDNTSTSLITARINSTTGSSGFYANGPNTKTPFFTLQNANADIASFVGCRTSSPPFTGCAAGDAGIGAPSGSGNFYVYTNGSGTSGLKIDSGGGITMSSSASHVSTTMCITSAGKAGYCSGGLSAVCGTCTAL